MIYIYTGLISSVNLQVTVKETCMFAWWHSLQLYYFISLLKMQILHLHFYIAYKIWKHIWSFYVYHIKTNKLKNTWEALFTQIRPKFQNKILFSYWLLSYFDTNFMEIHSLLRVKKISHTDQKHFYDCRFCLHQL